MLSSAAVTAVTTKTTNSLGAIKPSDVHGTAVP
jgi:hypothetical protein